MCHSCCKRVSHSVVTNNRLHAVYCRTVRLFCLISHRWCWGSIIWSVEFTWSLRAHANPANHHDWLVTALVEHDWSSLTSSTSRLRKIYETFADYVISNQEMASALIFSHIGHVHPWGSILRKPEDRPSERCPKSPWKHQKEFFLWKGIEEKWMKKKLFLAVSNAVTKVFDAGRNAMVWVCYSSFSNIQYFALPRSYWINSEVLCCGIICYVLYKIFLLISDQRFQVCSRCPKFASHWICLFTGLESEEWEGKNIDRPKKISLPGFAVTSSSPIWSHSCLIHLSHSIENVVLVSSTYILWDRFFEDLFGIRLWKIYLLKKCPGKNEDRITSSTNKSFP